MKKDKGMKGGMMTKCPKCGKPMMKGRPCGNCKK